jgi:malate dehydrogenase (oxaloacetate-decarboxylating)(NADP+)
MTTPAAAALSCRGDLYYAPPSWSPPPVAPSPASRRPTLSLTLFLTAGVLLALLGWCPHPLSGGWLPKHVKKVARVIPGVGKTHSKPIINVSEDIDEIGEQIFESVVNSITVPVPPTPLAAGPPDLPLVRMARPQNLPAMDAAALTAPRLTTLPPEVQGYRAALNAIKRPLEKYSYLLDLRVRDLDGFYRLVLSDLPGILPYVYTPTVGEGCQQLDVLFQGRQIPGLFIRSTDKGNVPEVLDTWGGDVDIIVVTDGSRILGLGDLGTNGMGIPIGKLALYSAIGGFDPRRTLPLTIDVGTDTTALRERPTYPGLRMPRPPDGEYFALLDEVVAAVVHKWPCAVLQFEDFSSPHCFQLLEKYRHAARIFNDDIQGTGAVIAAGFVNAAAVADVPLGEQRIVFYGAGAAGQGVADAIKAAMVGAGVPEAQARSAFYFVDSKGLVTTTRGDRLPAYKVAYARTDLPPIASLRQIIRTVRPTALIGLSAVPNAFSKDVVVEMAKLNRRPIIFALSNPTSKSELAAEKAITWTQGRVVYAAGSPYAPVKYGGRKIEIAQGNNLYIFPGLGLGAFLSQATEVSDGMVAAASRSLAQSVAAGDLQRGYLFPPLSAVRRASAIVAAGVMEQARAEGLARLPGSWPEDTVAYVESRMWSPAP